MNTLTTYKRSGFPVSSQSITRIDEVLSVLSAASWIFGIKKLLEKGMES